MDTQALKAFIDVADCRSFSLAAEKLHITQPAVSKRIASLELQLDCKLFDRIGRNIQLTEAGLALYPKAQKILQYVEEASRTIKELKGSVAGTLRLGISHHIGLHRLPPVLQAFSKQYPKVRLDIDFMDSEEAHEQITQGKLDLAVVTLSPDGNNHLRHETLWPDELSVVVSLDHPLAALNQVDLSTLSQFHAILPGLNTYTGQIVAQLFEHQQLKLDVSMETNYLETIKMMVSVGLGWSVLPKTMISRELAALNVKGIGIKRNLGYVHHPNRSMSNASRAFVEALILNRDKQAIKEALSPA